MKALISLLFFLAGPAFAAPYLTFEGKLADGEGALLEGPVALTFAVYDRAEGGDPLWTETHPEIEVLQGDFLATLGTIEPFGTTLSTDRPLWLGLSVDGDLELAPRNLLTEVPRAAAALWAADVSGQHIHPSEISIGDRRVIDGEGNWVGPGGPGGGGAPDYRYRFTDLDAQGTNICGLLPDGEVVCFGQVPVRVSPGPFESITVGSYHACALDADGSATCWGAGQGAVAPPPGPFRQVAAGELHTCGLREDGTIICWGSNDDGQTTAPVGRFRSICAGYNGACGIVDGTGTIQCWGAGRRAMAPPGDGYVGVSCSGEYACGWRADNLAACSGNGAAPPPGLYRKIEAAYGYFCGFDPANVISCWGLIFPGAHRRGPGLTGVTLGGGFACGLRQDGTATCWGGSGQFFPHIPERFAP